MSRRFYTRVEDWTEEVRTLDDTQLATSLEAIERIVKLDTGGGRARQEYLARRSALRAESMRRLALRRTGSTPAVVLRGLGGLVCVAGIAVIAPATALLLALCLAVCIAVDMTAAAATAKTRAAAERDAKIANQIADMVSEGRQGMRQ